MNAVTNVSQRAFLQTPVEGGLAYHKMKTMMLFSANYSALKREEATQTGGKIIRNVGPIGRVLASIADAYDVPVPYTSAVMTEIFSG